MPNTRRSNYRSAGGGTTSRQSTLSFNHRVTKASVPAASAKHSSPLAKHVSTPPASAKKVAEKEEEEEEEQKRHLAVDDKADVTLPDEPALAPTPTPEREKTEAELRAEQVTDGQVEGYWRALEAERLARRVHQEELGLAEKVLRYWDVSSQYGPCVGVSRRKRWERADRLGLSPPIEVLAILLKEEARGPNSTTPGIERAHMDEILNSTAAGGNAGAAAA